MNDDDFPYTRDPAAGPKETFPRGPSNEQHLLTELGKVKAESEEIYRHLEQCRIERDALRRQIDSTYCAYCGHPVNVGETAASREEAATLIGQHIASCSKHPMRAVEAERDALAVTAERMRLALLRISAGRWDHAVVDVQAIIADALLCTVEELEGME